ncbi:hypothetical protein DSECCO2_506510 [anaerobic digester metagenome]
MVNSSIEKNVSDPSLELAAQYLITSAEWFSIINFGENSELLFDLLIFSPFLARTKPQIIISFHGIWPVW